MGVTFYPSSFAYGVNHINPYCIVFG
jgi:hypothetical protein